MVLVACSLVAQVPSLVHCIDGSDVVVLGLHYWSLLKGHGLKELWIRTGVVNSTRHIPLHTLADKMNPDICKVILPVHHLTGCDSTSKLGTKAASLKAEPAQHLQEFGKDPSNIDFGAVEQYLVNVLKSGTVCQTMDQLRYYLYHHSKKTIVDLPPTSRSLKGHILRAFYGMYLQLHCLDNVELSPCEFGLCQDDGALLPDRQQALLPDDFPMPCNCTTCGTKRCPCRQNEIKCCCYCRCQATGKGCRNPVS